MLGGADEIFSKFRYEGMWWVCFFACRNGGRSRWLPGMNDRARLPRLDPGFYRGRAAGHWTMAMEDRATGWLDECFHLRLREILVHVGVRYHLVFPVYCLMPDHAHFLVMGCRPAADQRLGIRMLRKSFTRFLPEGIALQRQAHDHVLREAECQRGAFENLAGYILQNPLRAGLVEEETAYAFCGSIVPGYPSLDPHREGFWESFWMAFEAVSVDA